MLKSKIFIELLEKYRQLNLFIKLIVNGIVLYFLWTVFFMFFRNLEIVDFIYEEGTFYMTNIHLGITKFLLDLINYPAEIYGKSICSIQYGTSILLDRGCLGRNPIGLFVGFILAYPGDIKNKIWYIPLGLLVFSILNTIRIIGLYITNIRFPEYMDLNHHFVFKIIIYIFIFLMWYIWIKKINKFSNNYKKPNENIVAEKISENNPK